MDQVLEYFDLYKAYETGFILGGRCYQHIEELACHIIFPECDPVTKQVVHPCREMCWALKEACLQKGLSLAKQVVSKYGWDQHILNDFSIFCDCDYLPSINGSVPCFYKPVTCDSPPDVTSVTMLNTSQNDVYQLQDVVQYDCVNETDEMRGNNTITCLYSGQWSHSPPQCTSPQNSVHPLQIVLPVLIIPLVVIFIIIIKFKIKSKTIMVLSRVRDFDSFVCYKFDTDNDYVVNVILKSLEELCEPPLRLCVHERDFLPGLHIKDNIKDAVTKSNSAIIVMSQAFIDSDWCQEEFAHCYLENMKDPAFKIFMIMMQPTECLDNLSEYMKRFIASKTYLSKYDVKLFQKIICYLYWLKLPKDKKTREPTRFETCEALLKTHDEEEDDLTDSEIELDFVPSDPFLCLENDDNKEAVIHHADTFQNKDCQILHTEVEIHHSH